jgi:peptidoglycan/xylan/chitin deacetylase (PgdA/CDA1 family)
LLILEYHRVAVDGPERLRPWRIDPALFAAHMRYVASSGMHVVTPSQWFKVSPEGASIAITFDDAYDDFDGAAWPVLDRLGLSVEVYVPTAFVGGRSVWDGVQDAAPLMSWNRIRALRDAGVSFNSHAHAHTRLGQLPQHELVDELRVSREMLQQELATAVDTIAYPYGLHDERVLEAARACGYEFGLTVEMGYCSRDSERLRLPRFEVQSSCSLSRFEKALSDFATPAI